MIDRRAFFRIAAGAGTASLAAACKWDGGNAVRPRLLDISRVNDWVSEKLLYSPSRLAREYAVTERTANVPSYFISRTVPMLQDRRMAAAGRRPGAPPSRFVDPRSDADAAHDVHGQAPLRGGVERGLHLAWSPGFSD